MVYTTKVIATGKMPNNSLGTLVPENTTLPIILPKSTITTTTSTIQTTFKIHNVTSTQGMSSITTPSFSSSRLSSYSTSPTKFTTGSDISTDISSTASSDKSTELSTELTSLSSETSMASSQSSSDTTISFETTHILSTSKRTLLTSSGMTTVISTIDSSTISVISDSSVSYKTSDITKTSPETKSPSSYTTDSGSSATASSFTKVTEMTMSPSLPKTRPTDTVKPDSSSVSFAPSVTSNVTEVTEITSTATPGTQTRFTTKSALSSTSTVSGTTTIVSPSTKVTVITVSSVVPETSPIDISTPDSSSISSAPSITPNVTQLTEITAGPATGSRFTTKSTIFSHITDLQTKSFTVSSTKVTDITISSPFPKTSQIDNSTTGSTSISFAPSRASYLTKLTELTSTAEPTTGTRFTTQSVVSSHKTDLQRTTLTPSSTKVTDITISSHLPETSSVVISTPNSSSISFVPSITSKVTKLTAETSTAEPATGKRLTTQSPPSSHKTDSGTTEIISASTKVTGITESSLVPETSSIDISTTGSRSPSFVPSIKPNVTKHTGVTSTAEPATGTRFTTKSAPSSHKTDSGTTEIISISTKVTAITESSPVPETSPIDTSTAGSSSISFVPSITSNLTKSTAVTSTAEPATGTRFTKKSPPSSYKTDPGTTEIISISTKVTGITESSLVPKTSPMDISTAGSSSFSFAPSITSNVTQLTAITSTAEPATGTRFKTKSTPSSHKTDSGTTEIISISTKVTAITESSLLPETSPIDISTAGSSSFSFVPSITSNVTQLTAITSTAEPATGTRFTTQFPPSSHKTDSGTTEIISISTKVTGITESSLVPKTSPIDISTAGSSSISFVPSITSNVTKHTSITSTAEPATGTRFTTKSSPSSHKTDAGTTEINLASTKVTGITESSLVTAITESSPVPETSPIDTSTAGSSSISFVPSITSNLTKSTAVTSTAEPATGTRFTKKSPPSSYKTDPGTTEIISISTKVTGITESSLVPETSPIDISTAGSSSISFVPSITSNVTQLTAITSTAEPATATRFTTQSSPSSHKTDSGTTEIISISTKVTGITESSLVPATSPMDISTAGSSSVSFVPSITSNVTHFTAITSTTEPATGTRFTTKSAPSSHKTDSGTTEIISISTKVTAITESSLVPETSPIDISTAGSSSISFVPSITSNVTQLTAVTSTAEPATGTRFTTQYVSSSHKTDSGTTEIISISTKVTAITESSLAPETSPMDISTAGSSSISFVPSITSNVTKHTSITSTAEPATGTRFTTKSSPPSHKTDAGTTEINLASTKVTGITESSLVPETSSIDISTTGSRSTSLVPSITSTVTKLTGVTSTEEPATGTRFKTKSASSSHKTDPGTTEIISISTKVTAITESSPVPETSQIDISTASSSSISFVPSITSNITQLTAITSTAESATGTRFTTKFAPSSHKTDSGTTEIISASTKVTGITESSLVPETSSIDISTTGSRSTSFVPSITSNVTKHTGATSTAEPATGTRFKTKSAPSSHKTDPGTTEIISISTKVTAITESSPVPETSPIDISTAGSGSISFVPSITSNVTQLTAITSTAEPATGTRFTTKSAPSSQKTDSGTTEIISISTKVTGITESSLVPKTSPIDISTAGSSSISFVPSITSNVTKRTAITSTAEPVTGTRFTTQYVPSSHKIETGTTEIISISTKVTAITESSLVPKTSPIDISTAGSSPISFVPSITSNVTQLTAITSTAEPVTGTRFTIKSPPSSRKTDSGTTEIISISTKVTAITESSLVPNTSPMDISTAGSSSISFVPSITSNVTKHTSITSTAEPATGTRFTTKSSPPSHKTDAGTTEINLASTKVTGITESSLVPETSSIDISTTGSRSTSLVPSITSTVTKLTGVTSTEEPATGTRFKTKSASSSHKTDPGTTEIISISTKVTAITESSPVPETSQIDISTASSSSISFVPSITSNITQLTAITSTAESATGTRFTTKFAPSSHKTDSGTTEIISASTKVTGITESSLVPETSSIDISTTGSRSTSFVPSITSNVTKHTGATSTAEPATGTRFKTKSAPSSHKTDPGTTEIISISTKVTAITESSPVPETSPIDISTAGSSSISFVPSITSNVTQLTAITSTAEPATGTRFTTKSAPSSQKTDSGTTEIISISTKVTGITESSLVPKTSPIDISTAGSSSISFVPSITSNVTKRTAITSTAEPVTGTRFTTQYVPSSHKIETGTTEIISISTKVTAITESSLVPKTSPIDISTAGSSPISFVPSITSNVTQLTAITSTAEPVTGTRFTTKSPPSSRKTDSGTTEIISISTKVTAITESSLVPNTSPIDISTVGSSSISFVPSITSNVTQLPAITSTAEPVTGTRFTTKSTPSSLKTDSGTTEIISISTKVTAITESSPVSETSPMDISTAGSSSISFVPSITSNVTQLTAITSTAEPATGTRFTTKSAPSSHKTDSGTTEIISISTKVTGITESSLVPETSPIDISTAGSSSFSFVPSITSNVTQLTAITSTAEPATSSRFTTKSAPSSHKTDAGTTEISISTKVTGITESSLVPETSPIDISTAGSSSISFVPSITSNVTQLTAITSTAESATGTRLTTKSAPSSHKTDSRTTEIISISTKVTAITESSLVPKTSPIDISTAASSSISFVPSITSNVTQLTAITSTAEPATGTRFTTKFPPSSHKTDSGTTEIISISTKVTAITESSVVPKTSPIDISTAGSSSISFVPSITSNVTKRTAVTSTAEPATGTRFTTKSTPSSHKTDSGTTEIISISTKVTRITKSSLFPETSPNDISIGSSSSISFVPSVTSNVTQLPALTSTAEPVTGTRLTTQSPPSSHKTDPGTTEIISASTKVTGITESSLVPETSSIDISTVPSITSNVTKLTVITSTAEPATRTRFITTFAPSSHKTDSGTTKIISVSTNVTRITVSSIAPETSPIEFSSAGPSSISFVPSITSNVTTLTAVTATAEPVTGTRFTTQPPPFSHKTDSATTEIISASTKVTGISISSLVPETSPIDISTAGSRSTSFVPSITSNVTQLTAITSTAELATGTRFTTKSSPSSHKTESGTTEIISILTKVTAITKSSLLPETSPIDISTAGSSSFSFVPSITSNVTQRTAITSTAEPATGTRSTTKSAPSSHKTDSGTTEIISISTKVTAITESSPVPETSPIDISTAGSSSFSFVPSITSNVTQLTAITSTAEPVTGTRFTTQYVPSSHKTETGTTEIISISTKVTAITESSPVPETSPIDISTAGSSSISFVPSITSNVTKLTAITSTAEPATRTRFITTSAPYSHKTDSGTTKISSVSTNVTRITVSSIGPGTSPYEYSSAGPSSISFVPSITSNVTKHTAITTAEPATGTRFTTKSAPSSHKTDSGTTEIISISTKVTGITESSPVPETSPIDISTAGSSSFSFVPSITSNVTQLTAITSTAEPVTGTRFTTQYVPSSHKTETGTTEIISISTKVTRITESSPVPETSPMDISTAGSSSISFVPSITSNVTKLTAITSTAEPATRTRFITTSAPYSHKTDSGTTKISSVSTKVTRITVSSIGPGTSPYKYSSAGPSSISFVPSITSNVTKHTAITSATEPATGTRFTTKSVQSSHKTDPGTTEIISISTKVSGITESSPVPETSPIDISTAGSSSFSFVPSITSKVTKLTAITSTAEPATGTRLTTKSPPSSHKTDSGTTGIISISTKVTAITESSPVPETSPIDISTAGSSSISFVPSITSNVTQLTAITSTAEPVTGTRFTTQSVVSSHKTDLQTTTLTPSSTKVTDITISSHLLETSSVVISTPNSSSISFVPSITSKVTKLTAETSTAEPATGTRLTTISPLSSHKTDSETTEIISISTKVTAITESSPVPETSPIDISTAGSSSFSFVPSITSNVTQRTAITSTAEPVTGTRFTTQSVVSSHKTDLQTTTLTPSSTKVTDITISSHLPETSSVVISTPNSSSISFVPSKTSNVTKLTAETSTAEPATGTRLTTKSPPSSHKTDSGTTEIISISTKVTAITESSPVPETSPIDISTAGSSLFSFVPSITSNVTQRTAITSTAEPVTGTRFTTQSVVSSHKTDLQTTTLTPSSTKVTDITISSHLPETSSVVISTPNSSSISFVPSITSNVTKLTAETSTAEPATGTRLTTISPPSSHKTDSGTTEIISASTKVTGITESSLVPETSSIDISTAGSRSTSFVPSITSNVTKLTGVTSTAEPATGTRFTTQSDPSSHKTDPGTTEIISISTKVTAITESSPVPETSPIDTSTAGSSSISFVPSITSKVTKSTTVTSTAEPATGTRLTTKSATSSHKTESGTTEIISVSTYVTRITESSPVPETSPIDISTAGSSSFSFVPSITSNVTQLTAITSTAEPVTGTPFTTQYVPSSHKRETGTTEIISISTKVTAITESSPVPETSPMDISTAGSSSISFVPSITSNVTKLTAITSTAEPATRTRFITTSAPYSHKTDSGTTKISSVSTNVTRITVSSIGPGTSPYEYSSAGPSSISFVPSITSNVTKHTAITSATEPATGTRLTTKSVQSSHKTDPGTTEIISISTKVTRITESSPVPETSPIDISTAGSSSFSFVPSITSNVTQRTAITSTAEPVTGTRFTTQSVVSSHKTDLQTTTLTPSSTKVTDITISSHLPETSSVVISTPNSSSISFVPSITSKVTKLTAETSTAEPATGTRLTTKSPPSSHKTDSGTTGIISISTKVTGITESSPVLETSPIDISTAGSSSFSFVPSITSNVTKLTAITSTAEPVTGTRFTTQSVVSSHKTDLQTTTLTPSSTKVTDITISSHLPETSSVVISTPNSSSISFVPSITSKVTKLTAETSTAEPATGTRLTTISPPSSHKTDSGTTEIISISTKVTAITESSPVPETSPIDISTAGSSSFSFVPSITSNVTQLTAITSTAEPVTGTRFTTQSVVSSHKTDLQTTTLTPSSTKVTDITISSHKTDLQTTTLTPSSTKVTDITISSHLPETSSIVISTPNSSSISFVPSITSNVTKLTAETSTAEPATGTRLTTQSPPSSHKTDSGTTEIISASTKVTGITESSLVPETSSIDISTTGSRSTSFVPSITSNVTKLTGVTSTAEPATGTRFTTKSATSSHKTESGTTEIISVSTYVTRITVSSIAPETSPIEFSSAGPSSISFGPSITSNVTKLTEETSTAGPVTGTRLTTQIPPFSHKTDSATTEIISASTKVTGISISSLVPETSPIDISTAGSSSISFLPSKTSNVTKRTAITSTAEPATGTRFTTKSAPSSHNTDSGTTEIISISTKVTGITESSLVPKTSPIDISTAESSSFSFVPSITSNVTKLTAIISTAEPATRTRITTKSSTSSHVTDLKSVTLTSSYTLVTDITRLSPLPETSSFVTSTSYSSSISFAPSMTSNVSKLTEFTTTAESATESTTNLVLSSLTTTSGTTAILSSSTKVTDIAKSTHIQSTSTIVITSTDSRSISYGSTNSSKVTKPTERTTEPVSTTQFTTDLSSHVTNTGTTTILSASTKVTEITISSVLPESTTALVTISTQTQYVISTDSITSYETIVTTGTQTSSPNDTCACCERRVHGHLVVMATVTEKKCTTIAPVLSSKTPGFNITDISTTVRPEITPNNTITTTEKPTSSPKYTCGNNEICCEGRAHGRLVVVASVIEEDSPSCKETTDTANNTEITRSLSAVITTAVNITPLPEVITNPVITVIENATDWVTPIPETQTTTSKELPCNKEGCCETRLHGHLVVFARIISG